MSSGNDVGSKALSVGAIARTHENKGILRGFCAVVIGLAAFVIQLLAVAGAEHHVTI